MKKFVRKNKKGFTLTEMIVVIAIIGILAAVMIPSVVIYVNKARESAAYQEAAAVYDVYEAYLTEKEAGLLVNKGTEEGFTNLGEEGYDFEDYYFEITGKKLATGTSVDEDTHILTYTLPNNKTAHIKPAE